jgi:hypothetical protein
MYPAEWAGRRIEVLAVHYPIVWVEDPYHLISQEEIQTLESRLALLGRRVVNVEDALHLRYELNEKDASSGNLVLIDQSYTLRDPHLLPKDAKPSDLVSLPAPDWKRLVSSDAIFRPTIRDFLISVTEDPNWPIEVNIFPYEALAQTDAEGFVRAFRSFRQTGRVLTSDDLVLVGASAVMKIDLMDVSDPIQALELAFHSEDEWRHLTDFFNRTEIEHIRRRLQSLPAPIGELFGNDSVTARLALISLVVLSQHAECIGFESPGRQLSILSPALAPYVGCPAAPVREAPSWFIEQEVPRFDDLVDSKFLSYLYLTLQLNIPENASRFAEREHLSPRLRSQVAYEVRDGKSVPRIEPRDLGFSIDDLIPRFRDNKQTLNLLIRKTKDSVERLRLTPRSELRASKFLEIFDSGGVHRMDALIGSLNSLIRDIEGPAKWQWQSIPGFKERWSKDLQECRDLMSNGARLRDDLDFEFGRFLESRYSEVVPSEVWTTGLFQEKFIAPRRRRADGKLTNAVILVIDGMRLDIWRQLIRPALEREYAIEETLGFAELPSETVVSRASFFAGKTPGELQQGCKETDSLADAIRRLHGSPISFADAPQKRQGMRYYVRSSDGSTYAGVFNFPDQLSHHVDWDQHILQEAYRPFVREIRAVLAEAGPDPLIFITSDHGHYRREGGSPVFLENTTDVGYRSAYVTSRIEGERSKHLFQLAARTIRHDQNGYYVFPKPGFHLRSRDAHTTAGKSDAGYRHGGLSMAEVVVPVVALRHRLAPTSLFLDAALALGTQVGIATTIRVSVSADGLVSSPIRLQADTSEVEPIIISGATSTPESHELRLVPAAPGRRKIKIDAVFGDQVVASKTIEVDVAPALMQEDEAKTKLRKLWGDD